MLLELASAFRQKTLAADDRKDNVSGDFLPAAPMLADQ